MTTPLRTYAEYLEEEGKVSTGTFDCPECEGPAQPAFAIVEAAPGRWICSTCHISEQAQIKADQQAEALAQLGPWETQEANDVRQVRTLLQEKWRWTVMPDSPLTEAAKSRYMTMLQALNTLTIDFQSPADVVWPNFQNPEANDYVAQ